MGRRPSSAAPMQSPAAADSEMGVSKILAGPNSSHSPSVERSDPPNGPMSWPIRNTFGSRRISSRIALDDGLDERQPLARHLRPPARCREHVVQSRGRSAGCPDAAWPPPWPPRPLPGAAPQTACASSAESTPAADSLSSSRRIGSRPFHSSTSADGPVGRGVRRNVAPHAKRGRLDQRRAQARPGPLHGFLDGCVDGQDVVAIDSDAGQTVPESAIHQCLGRRRLFDGEGDRVVVVLNDVDDGESPDCPQVDRLVEVPPVARPVAEGDHAHGIALPVFLREGRAGGLGDDGAQIAGDVRQDPQFDGSREIEVAPSGESGALPHRPRQYVLQPRPAHQVHDGGPAISRSTHIVGPQPVKRADRNRLLSLRGKPVRRLLATDLVEHAAEHHPPVHGQSLLRILDHRDLPSPNLMVHVDDLQAPLPGGKGCHTRRIGDKDFSGEGNSPFPSLRNTRDRIGFTPSDTFDAPRRRLGAAGSFPRTGCAPSRGCRRGR